MNLPTVFNIAIGLVFIYLVLSLLASQIQEVTATLLQWRAKHLKGAIENLILGDTEHNAEIDKSSELVGNLFRNPLIQNLNQTSKSWLAIISKNNTSKKVTLPNQTASQNEKSIGNSSPSSIPAETSKVTNQDQIASQKEKNTRNSSSPSYMPAETFSTTVLYELSIPRLGRFLTWLNIEKLIYNEIYSKIDTLFNKKEYKSIKTKELDNSYTNLQSHFKHVLDDYKQERYGLSSTIIRLRNQVENFKREIEESLPTKSTTLSDNVTPSSQLSDISERKQDHNRKTLKDLINQILDFVFTPDKKDHDLFIRLRPSLTTLLDLLDKDSKAYESCEKEFPEASHLRESFEFVQKEFDKISKILPDNLRKSLYALALRSRIKTSDIEQQLDQFKQEIEIWFDRSMDRATGMYTRNARGFAFLIGLVLAVSLNADTFYIVSRLAKDDDLRNSIVNTSSQLVERVQSSSPPTPTRPSPPPKAPSTTSSSLTLSPTPSPSLNTIERVKDNVDQSLSEITLPIGWNDNILDEQLQVSAPIKENETFEEKQKREKREKEKNRRIAKFFGHPIPPVIIMIMGWLVTATAIMMGAPFWFDFLGLFINVRNTGSKPASKTDKN